MDSGDQDPAQGQPAQRISAAVAARLDALHELAPLRGRRLLMAHAFLLAASSDAELDTAAAAHQAQADQLTDRRLVEALRDTYRLLEPTWHAAFRQLGHGASLADVLDLTPPEQAELAEATLRVAGLDPRATGWPFGQPDDRGGY
jgi:hypothetical protein